MTRDDVLQGKRNALLVAILDYVVEIGEGVAAAQLEDESTSALSLGDVVDLRADVREWLGLRKRLSSGAYPLDVVADKLADADRLSAIIEGNWPLALVLVDTVLDEGFRPLRPE